MMAVLLFGISIVALLGLFGHLSYVVRNKTHFIREIGIVKDALPSGDWKILISKLATAVRLERKDEQKLSEFRPSRLLKLPWTSTNLNRSD